MAVTVFTATGTKTGTSGSIPFFGSSTTLTEDNASLFWHAASKCFCIGTNTPIGVESVNITKEGSQLYQGAINYVDDASGFTFIAAKSRGSKAAPRRAQSGDNLFNVAAFGAYAADDVTDATVIGGTSARFTLTTTQAHTASAKGTSFIVSLCPNGSTTLTDVMIVTGVGVVTLPGYANGTASFVSGVLTSSSDERLKTAMQPFRRGLKAINRLKPITYRWKKRSGITSRRRFAGFGARQVERHIPEAISKDKRGMRSKDDCAILAAAVNAIQELSAKVDRLERAAKKRRR